MESYYLNNHQQANGDYEVHTSSCKYLPSIENRTYLGLFSNCKDAVHAARRVYPSRKIDGCYYCCNPCHTS